jgi:hypothetical protein
MCIRRVEEMATITDLMEYLDNGGKVRRPCWGKGINMILDNTGFYLSTGSRFSSRQLFFDDWEVYKEPRKKKFKITHTGLYKTRNGRMALVSCEVKDPTLKAPFYGVVEGGLTTRWWTKSGKNVCEPYEDGKEFDIVSEWES